MPTASALGQWLRKALAGHEKDIAQEVVRLRSLHTREELAAYAREKGAAARKLVAERGPEVKEALRRGLERFMQRDRSGPDSKDR